MSERGAAGDYYREYLEAEKNEFVTDEQAKKREERILNAFRDPRAWENTYSEAKRTNREEMAKILLDKANELGGTNSDEYLVEGTELVKDQDLARIGAGAEDKSRDSIVNKVTNFGDKNAIAETANRKAEEAMINHIYKETRDLDREGKEFEDKFHKDMDESSKVLGYAKSKDFEEKLREAQIKKRDIEEAAAEAVSEEERKEKRAQRWDKEPSVLDKGLEAYQKISLKPNNEATQNIAELENKELDEARSTLDDAYKALKTVEDKSTLDHIERLIKDSENTINKIN